ncbi:hypothetical protein EG68_02822 [Paragonimus skrjabini miyazakii]|uniref:Cationic amino acid transporter C-terminal domain-containing protein n=1 Tax=Paragonimus skrjabini miyazakii TaxID=59628 RepID=A0A8S9YYG4_9TREM|nr:hypothetical protein EG68_02822 [Paragonimus skrjabini miyazakii]
MIPDFRAFRNGLKNFFSNLSRKKTISASEITQTQLSRCLSVVDLTALGIGSTLGAGVYVVIGEVARLSAGPAVILSFLIAALSSILSGLCYAEFGARVPKTGSAYIYSYVAVGEFMAFISGWNLILQYLIGTSSVARAWSSNFDGLVDGKISGFFSEHLAMNSTGLADYADPFAFGITMLVTAVLSFGAQESSLVNNIFTLINLGVISYVTITGLFRVDISNWQVNPEKVPSSDPNKNHVGAGGFLPFGISGVISGAGTCFYSFVGFDIIATTGEEARNPQRAIPIAIMGCLLVCFVAYAAVSAVLTLMVPYYAIPQIAPLPYAFNQAGWYVAKYVIAVGAVCALTTSLLGAMFPMPRILYAMAKDGLIFRFLARVNKRWKTPLIATVLSGLIAGFMAAVFSLKDLVDMMSIGTLLAYSLVAVSILILRGQRKSVGLVVANAREKEFVDGIALDPKNLEHGYSSPVRTDHPVTSVDSEENETYQGPVPPASFSEYFRLSFVPHSGQVCPSAKSEWINLTHTYLLLLDILLLNVGLIYFDGDIQKPNFAFFVTACVIIVVFGSLMILLCISLARQPENQAKVTFKVPGVPWIPALSILVNLHLMFKMSGTTWVFYAVWMVIGFLVYFGYGYWFSSEKSHLKSTSPIARYDSTLPEIVGNFEEQ